MLRTEPPIVSKLKSLKAADIAIFGILLLIGGVVLYVRFRHLGMPLERDEGEYAYGAQLLLQGEELYDNVYSLKWPGIFWSYAAILLVFGQTASAIHFGVVILNVSTAYLVYKLCKHLVSSLPALIGGLCYLIFTIQRELQGITANSEHFVIFYFSIALLFIFKYRAQLKPPLLFWAGVFSGLSFLNKQHAIGYLLAAFAILLLFEMERVNLKTTIKSLVIYSSGIVLPLLIALLWVFVFDNSDRFWFHTVTYAREYVTLITVDEAWHELSKRIAENMSVNPILWGLFAITVITMPFIALTKKHWKILYPLLFGAMIATSIGFYFRPHYVMFMALAGSLFLAVTFEYILFKLSPVAAIAVFVLGSLSYFMLEKEYLFEWDSNWTSYQMYYRYPFREAKIVGNYLSAESQPNDRVLVIGAEPQINFYAQRKSVTGYIYSYPFFENHPFAEEMSNEWMEEIDADHPKYIVLMGHWTTYGSRQSTMFKKIWEFSASFISDNNYQLIGEVDLPIQDGGQIWGENAQLRQTESENWIRVYKRK